MYRNNRIIIYTDRIVNNYRNIKKKFENTKILAVLKANAYGHGIINVAKKLQECDCDGFCVAILEEAILLRNNGIVKNIFLLSPINYDSIEIALKNNIILCVNSLEYLKILIEKSKKIKIDANIHIAINTGMNRIGINTRKDLLNIINVSKDSGVINIISTFTHLCFADDLLSDGFNDYSKKQINLYDSITSKTNISKSLANSASIINFKDYNYDYARIGILLYGYPFKENDIYTERCLEWKTEIISIIDVKKGEYIGYSNSYYTNKDIRVASIAVGYGDGYLRSLSNKALVLVNGKYAKVISNICMDQTLIDISDIPEAKIGDTVTLIGKDGQLEITADDLAKWADTISYEILLSHSQRVEVVYI